MRSPENLQIHRCLSSPIIFRPKDSLALPLQLKAAAEAGPTSPLKRLRFPFPPQGSSLGSDFASHCSSRSLGLRASLAKFPDPDPRVCSFLGQCEQRGAGRGARGRLRVNVSVWWEPPPGPVQSSPSLAPQCPLRLRAAGCFVPARQGAEAVGREQNPRPALEARFTRCLAAVVGTLDLLLFIRAHPE